MVKSLCKNIAIKIKQRDPGSFIFLRSIKSVDTLIFRCKSHDRRNAYQIITSFEGRKKNHYSLNT